jgi:hypothetical protein
MSFLSSAFTLKRKKADASAQDESSAAGRLFVRFSDCGWKAALTDKAGASLWSASGICFPDNPKSATSEAIALALQALEQAGFSDQVGSVVALADDADLQLVDHRLAHLNNFEPRGLKEFGAQEAGGRPVAFASRAFGASSVREVERRILSFLPEETLEGYFFGLGRFATSLTAVLPGPITSLAASDVAGVFAVLRVHGNFSHLVVANADTGIVAVRRLSFGVFAVARAYAAEHGLTLEEAVTALHARGRLPALPGFGQEASPEYRTTTYMALAPLLTQLRDEITATIDYFRFERLAGRPAALSLVFSGSTLAGFDRWLADTLEIAVDAVEEPAMLVSDSDTWPLNLLEGARSGLLKLGNQPFEFSDGRFKAINAVHAGGAMKPASGLSAQLPFLQKLSSVKVSGATLTLNRERLMQGFAAVGMVVMAVLLNQSFLQSPAEMALAGNSANYSSVAAQNLELVTRKAIDDRGGERPGARPVLWAEDLASIGNAVSPNMTMLRIASLTPQTPDGMPVLEISGVLPSDSAANLKVVASFIDRLGADMSFRRRFREIQFTGAGEAPANLGNRMTFKVTARAGGQPQ